MLFIDDEVGDDGEDDDEDDDDDDVLVEEELLLISWVLYNSALIMKPMAMANMISPNTSIHLAIKSDFNFGFFQLVASSVPSNKSTKANTTTKIRYTFRNMMRLDI
jgi:hypothetical protein